MLKNRTLIGIILIAAAIGLCFGISPLFNSILSSKTKIIRLRQDIPQGVQITGAMLEAVEVGTLNLPADMQNDPRQIIGEYTVSAMFAGDSFTDKKLSDSVDTSDSLLRQQMGAQIIVDCTSDIVNSKLTAKAVINATHVVELLTCDTNGLVFDGSQEPILQSEQYNYRDFIRLMSLNSTIKQDEAAMKNALGRISGTIPYCPKAAEYLNQGTLLTKAVDDRTYNTTIKSLAELVTKEV